ncbi:hypothetical protein P691DRAFT_798642 [Macrolepiota fuliginosa MF-IS2]|uniref:Oxidoreductase-like domain-containing protein n=1 Tax=Macrolepiota fuliginosa MF-IS2 TaxID=1400762 RepID=A0A9P5XET0_9AGAR|nr:hypothetical protein P691DRAFT_798642 [Macrolepiota fuliginosa MF-IS2]
MRNPDTEGEPSTQPLINRIKSPGRGGRNLRNRHVALEKSLRGKEALTRRLDGQQQTAATNTPATPIFNRDLGTLKTPTFREFAVPTEPSPPGSDECCMSGCAVCVYDLYEESLEVYKESMEALRKNLVMLNIPEYKWPEHIQTKHQSGLTTQPEKRTTVVMNAFEEMERRLKEKHAAQEAEAPKTDAAGS